MAKQTTRQDKDSQSNKQDGWDERDHHLPFLCYVCTPMGLHSAWHTIGTDCDIHAV